MRIAFAAVAIFMLTAAPLEHRLLSDLQRDDWYEIQPGPGSLIGSSFRVLANHTAVEWMARPGAPADGVEFLKVNAITPGVWSNARVETVRATRTAGGGLHWSFYSFGPASDLASSASEQPASNCLLCHQRRQWRQAPLFLGLYATPVSPVRAAVVMGDDDGNRTLRVAPPER